MDTITIESTEDGVPNISYTSAEVLRFIEKAKDHERVSENLTQAHSTTRSIREKVRDFFSEGEWDDNEFTASREDINELLEAIGSYKLTVTYGGSFIITGTFSVDAEDEDTAADMFRDNVSIYLSYGDYSIDDVQVEDVQENY